VNGAQRDTKTGPPRFGSIPRTPLSKRVSDELIRSILRRELAPGDALPSEDALAAQFDVSRSVIRETVKELAVLGLVESRQGRATRVTPAETWNHFSPEILAARGEIGAVDDILLELLELRRLLETEAAALAASRAAEDDIVRLRAALGAMDATMADRERFVDGDIAFHRAILAATDNHLLTQLIDLMTPLLRFGRQVSLERRPDATAESQAGHATILRAIESGDEAAARAAMRDHLSWTADLDIAQRYERLATTRGRAGTSR
jgi:GntR family transcriptional repressor for pyruvate dehydrogenase complex